MRGLGQRIGILRTGRTGWFCQRAGGGAGRQERTRRGEKCGDRVCTGLHQQGLLASGPPPTCCRPEPLWHGLSTAGWGSDPQTLLEDAAQHGVATIIPPFFSVLQEGARVTWPGSQGLAPIFEPSASRRGAAQDLFTGLAFQLAESGPEISLTAGEDSCTRARARTHTHTHWREHIRSC